MEKASVKNEIAKNLTYYRKQQQMTQEDLGKQLDVKRNTISSWESGVNSIDADAMFQICHILNISVSDLFGQFANSIPISLNPEEYELILKYRSTPSIGQKAVHALLDVYTQNK